MEPAYTTDANDNTADRALIHRILRDYVVPHVLVKTLSHGAKPLPDKDAEGRIYYDVVVDLRLDDFNSYTQSAADFLFTNGAESAGAMDVWKTKVLNDSDAPRYKLFLVGFTETELMEVASYVSAAERFSAHRPWLREPAVIML